MLPPSLDTFLADKREYFAGISLNELSVCHKRFPKLNILLGSSLVKGLLFLSRLETSAKSVDNLLSFALVILDLLPDASISPKYLVNLTCSLSSMFWSLNTNTDNLLIALSISFTILISKSFFKSTP